MAKIGIFISYNHNDQGIANAIVDSLEALSQDLKVFIDHSGIEGGEEYERKLADAIARSQWFILIYSGVTLKSEKNMNWCFYEAGQFRSKLQEVTSVRHNRMCYLYDGDPPKQLTKYQGTSVTQFSRTGHKLNVETEGNNSLDLEDTELFSLFETIIKESSDAGPLQNVGTRTFGRGCGRA